MKKTKQKIHTMFNFIFNANDKNYTNINDINY